MKHTVLISASYTSFIAFNFLSIDTESSISLLKPSSKVLIDQETVTLSNFFNKSKSLITKSDFVHINSSASTPTNCSNIFLVFLYLASSGRYPSVTVPMMICSPLNLSRFLIGCQFLTSKNVPHSSVWPVNLFMNEA